MENLGIGNIILVAASLVFAAVFLHPRFMRWPYWRAMVTPLASIIGSGFLVAGPILSHTAGEWAWAAMLALCVIGYFYGAAIRHNIRAVEPLLDKQPSRPIWLIDEASDFALTLAYFISVAYYLNLFAAFALRAGGIIDAFWIKIAATSVIGFLGILGVLKGLSALEKLEMFAVGTKIALIAGLCTALAVLSVISINAGLFAWPQIRHSTGIPEIQVLLGLVILVQGFETSRYLGHTYSPEVRISTMRWAQIAATGIYLVFILLITRYFSADLPTVGGETAIIDMLVPIGALVGPLIIVTALSSQLSAAVADLNGAGGLVAETSRSRLSVPLGYAITAIAAIAVTWLANIYEIITFASKAFVIYYGLQSLQASLSCSRKKPIQAALYAAGVAFAVIIVIFAVPADV